MLAQATISVPKYVQEADQLTRFAVDTRYPGLSGPVSKREHRRALRIAGGILRWATRQVERLCPP
ncbi:MAG: HEPN domain-containing protein [Pirellulaceae bacterium]|nr:HEPN domain-containing protein [Pirellulaceae bacterium]